MEELLMKKIKTLSFILLCMILLEFPFAVFSYDDITKDALSNSFVLERKGLFLNAIKVLTAHYEQNKGDYFIQMRLAFLFNLSGKFENSLSHYHEAQKIKPQSLEPALGIMLVHMGSLQYSNALMVGQEIVKKDPLNYYANLRMVEVLSRMGKIKESFILIDKMIKTYPLNVGLLVNKLSMLMIYDKKNKVEIKSICTLLLILDSSQMAVNKYCLIKK